MSEVRLFGEEVIHEDLHLLVCEWPSVSDRVLVHGCRYSMITTATMKKSAQKDANSARWL